MAKKKKKRVLGSHTQKGKKFFPPFLANFPLEKISYLTWLDDLLPEFVWISMLHSQFEMRTTIEITSKFVHAVNNSGVKNISKIRAYICEYESIVPEDALKIQAELRKEGIFEKFCSCLIPLLVLYPECPFKKIFESKYFEENKVSVETALGVMKKVVSENFDRQSFEATITQVTAIHMILEAGGLKMTPEIAEKYRNMDRVLEYPKTEESRTLASGIRAFLNGMNFKDPSDKWKKYFWRQGYKVSVCEFI